MSLVGATSEANNNGIMAATIPTSLAYSLSAAALPWVLSVRPVVSRAEIAQSITAQFQLHLNLLLLFTVPYIVPAAPFQATDTVSADRFKLVIRLFISLVAINAS
jgi:hypothetical protein